VHSLGLHTKIQHTGNTDTKFRTVYVRVNEQFQTFNARLKAELFRRAYRTALAPL